VAERQANIGFESVSANDANAYFRNSVQFAVSRIGSTDNDFDYAPNDSNHLLKKGSF